MSRPRALPPKPSSLVVFSLGIVRVLLNAAAFLLSFSLCAMRFALCYLRQLLEQPPVPRNRAVHAKMLQRVPDFRCLGMDHGNLQLGL